MVPDKMYQINLIPRTPCVILVYNFCGYDSNLTSEIILFYDNP